MSEEKEYIVTLHNHSDCEQFYDEMESNKFTEFIPGKEFNCIHRREISRNTHYSMTDEEANQLRQDSRVLGIQETSENRGELYEKCFEWDSTTHFDKPYMYDATESNSKVQWGVLRSSSGNNTPSAEYTTDIPMPFDKVDTGDQEGEGVDVVIVDDLIDPYHPEFAVNRDGTGGTRVVQYTWSSGYTYNPSGESHGCHVSGTVAGNRQGWAVKADIYNQYFQGWNFDDIRTWHNNKTNGNPTVINNSWIGYNRHYWSVINYPTTGVTTYWNLDTVHYRGTTYTNVDQSTAASFGIVNVQSYYRHFATMPNIALDADLQDCMSDGIIVVCAANNFNQYYTQDPSHPDYNNYIIHSKTGGYPYATFDTNNAPFYYARGGSPACTPGVICVGNASSNQPSNYRPYISDSTKDHKAYSSSKGPRIDVWASGTNIQSSVQHSSQGITDNRTYSGSLRAAQDLKGGTSMASPQVCGVIACLVGKYRDFTQEDVRSWLISQGSTYDQIYTTSTTDYVDEDSIMDGSNRYLYFNRVRKGTGQVWPNPNHRTKVVQSPNNYPVQPALPTRQVYPRMKRNYNVP